jgi:hypothetical protein
MWQALHDPKWHTGCVACVRHGRMTTMTTLLGIFRDTMKSPAMCNIYRSRRPDAASVQVAIMLVAGSEVIPWRSGLRQLKAGMTIGLLRWFQGCMERLGDQSGFDIGYAIHTALHLSQGQVPAYLICGALQPALSVDYCKRARDSTGSSAGTNEIIQQIVSAQQKFASQHSRCAQSWC